ncbi:hypothetical protein NP233_g5062 [Leucocoprinus birnbaumii]|uniref:F-box domain-containing protein n=1 Tax=Leucocoprinus birnbaumii TaxID=56174 RepID=A0AAD5YRA6_9AGAR|nr:hypothetical protein NP233_g5062 [Leucocoprinus birnbaumii]
MSAPKSTPKRRKTNDLQSNPSATDAGNANVRMDKRVRGRRGLLKSITEMPMDLLLEIFGQLEPGDLLHLSWASKTLRVVIMERNSRFLWTNAFERLYSRVENPLPRCPEDMNLAQYARFLFEKSCMVRYSMIALLVIALARLMKTLLIGVWRGSGSPYFMDDAPSGVLVLFDDIRSFHEIEQPLQLDGLPLCLDDTRHDMLENVQFCLKQDHAEAEKAYNQPNPSNPSLGILEHHKTTRKQGMYDFEVWEENCVQERKEELLRLRNQWKAQILAKLAEIEWNVLRPRLIERLDKLQDTFDRPLQARKLQDRWIAFRDQFDVWVNNQKLGVESKWLPRVSDIAILEPFRTKIFTKSIQGATFQIDDIERAACTWMKSRINFLLALLPPEAQDVAIIGSAYNDSLQIPSLACLLFQNPSRYFGPDELCTIDDICSRRFTNTYRTSDSKEISEAEKQLRNILEEKCFTVRPWFWDFHSLELDVGAFRMAKGVIQMFGMNPYRATVSQMKECRLRFNCVHCPSGLLEVDDKNWIQIVSWFAERCSD